MKNAVLVILLTIIISFSQSATFAHASSGNDDLHENNKTQIHEYENEQEHEDDFAKISPISSASSNILPLITSTPTPTPKPANSYNENEQSQSETPVSPTVTPTPVSTNSGEQVTNKNNTNTDLGIELQKFLSSLQKIIFSILS